MPGPFSPSPSDRLLVNPTSGTKQMSVAAVLAALDEEVGMVIFTVGDRADGVVKTGTERMAEVNTAEFYLQQDLAQADFAVPNRRLSCCSQAPRTLRCPRPSPSSESALSSRMAAHELLRRGQSCRRFSQVLSQHLRGLHSSNTPPPPAFLSQSPHSGSVWAAAGGIPYLSRHSRTRQRILAKGLPERPRVPAIDSELRPVTTPQLSLFYAETTCRI